MVGKIFSVNYLQKNDERSFILNQVYHNTCMELKCTVFSLIALLGCTRF